ncbi:MAG: hypothetical protein LKM36_09695 [Flavobacteriales bacterium]|jgi:hypothetical protein|nr:hypothetical protein [Flavobacteriales bacterium]
MNVRKFAVAALAGAATAAAAQQPFDLDLTFRTNITGNFVLSVAPLVDGTILLSGAIKFPNYPLFPLGLAKIQSNGSSNYFILRPGGGIRIIHGRISSMSMEEYPTAFWRMENRHHVQAHLNDCNSLYYTPEQAGDYHVFQMAEWFSAALMALGSTAKSWDLTV